MFGFGDPERETGNPSHVTFFSLQTNDHITQYLTVFYVKNMNQNRNLPQVGVEIKNNLKPTCSKDWKKSCKD